MGERNHRDEVVSFAVGFNGANFTIKEGSNRFWLLPSLFNQ